MSNEKSFELKQVSIRLIEDVPYISDEKIKSPQDAVRVIGNEISKFDREVMCVLNLTADGKPINFSIVSMGTIDQTIVSPREMFKSSILSNAAQVVMIHNHPSGNVTPSRQDVKVTNMMIDLYDKMGIQLADHIIVGANAEGQYFSFFKENLFYHTDPKWSEDLSDVKFKVAENSSYSINTSKENVPNFGTHRENIEPSSEYYAFTAYNGQYVELNGADMRRVKRYYEEQSTADFLRENNPLWTEEKVQAVAIETRRQMLKHDFTEEQAIEEVLNEYETEHYVQLASKQVPDADGFMTDYTMYRDTFTGDYVFIFGDKEVYTPENTGADWKCEIEKIALEWFGDYKGFEESVEPKEENVLLRQFAFSDELRARVTKAAVSLVECVKNIDWYHFSDITEGEELDIAQAEKMIALNQTGQVIAALREYNTENVEEFLHASKDVNEIKAAVLNAAGANQESLIEEYADGKIGSEMVKTALGNTAYQLAVLYRIEKERFKETDVCQAREMLSKLVDLRRDIFIAGYKNIEPDLLFSDTDNYMAVYQLKDELEDFHYEDYNYFKQKNKEISLRDYEPVYVEKVEKQQDNEALFHRFNTEIPAEYVGHSLSVGDIIVKHSYGITDVGFVDSFGFQPIDFFVKEYALETNHLVHLIKQDGESYVCQSFNKENFSLFHTERMKLYHVGAHVRALDSLEDTYLKQCDVADVKEKIEAVNQQAAQTELAQVQHTRKPRL